MLQTALILAAPPASTDSTWGDPSSPQYHIQTDEGPERYFRYQTENGQYRKEKRLEDGTVVGSYAWIDDDGFLRQRDYIADNAGYRILKSKNLFVGRNVPVSQAMQLAKKTPASSGRLVKPAAVPVASPVAPAVQLPPTAYLPAKPTTPFAGYLPSGFTPNVDISPNSIPSSTESPLALSYTPSTTVLPPYASSTTPAPDAVVVSSTPPTVFIPSTTPSSPAYESSTRSIVSTTTHYREETFKTVTSPNPFRPTELFLQSPVASTLPPPIQSNSLDYYSGAPQYEHYPDETVRNPYVIRNGPTYPIDRRGQTYTGQKNAVGNGYDPQYKYYDGVSVTNDGFRYYIPRAYHEEQSSPDNEKTGSFGYIDPFGIRRVVYYNASPEKGFQHRKNNRYVGFDATPYDPRPV